MKATIDFDEQLYRRLKVEAARRGRTVRELVAEGVRYILEEAEQPSPRAGRAASPTEWRPPWLGVLAHYGRSVDDHSPDAIRASVVRGRAKTKQRRQRS